MGLVWKPGDGSGGGLSPNGRVILPSFSSVMQVTLLTNHPAPCQSTTPVYVEIECEEILRLGP